MSPQAVLLPDERRLHLQHGPIDLIVEAFGAAAEVRAAYAQAIARFKTILDELVAELPALRQPVSSEPVGSEPARVFGDVAMRMVAACSRHAGVFITPMAAVAGAVADEVLAALLAGRTLSRAYVNNGGDIAFYLAPEERFTIAIAETLNHPEVQATASVDASSPVRGVATSGQGGRSFSLGVADAVTVLAQDGARADAAATLVANAVNVASPAVRRVPARHVREDSDLGEIPVVVSVGPLSSAEIECALDAGLAAARRMQAAGLIEAAFLSLRGQRRVLPAAERVALVA